RVSAAEWQVLEGFLATQDETWVAQLLARNESLYGAFRADLCKVAEHWQRVVGQGDPNPHLAGLPTVCPALEDDRCSVYDARPLVCRAYGYFAHRIQDVETLLICREYGKGFLDSLKAQGLENAPLPNFEPFARQARRLNPSPLVKPLPLWLLEWEERRASAI
ncbi:MAG: YkgJ family cysteine cluster protein, partial [Cyanobacteria bacterium REEB65]|nr:YkgJ family cysteine cluster protein [Cyanobacteria bacterium REEB65]